MKKSKQAMQWKVVSGLAIGELERACETWTGRGWTVFAILGPFGNGLSLVLKRILTVSPLPPEQETR